MRNPRVNTLSTGLPQQQNGIHCRRFNPSRNTYCLSETPHDSSHKRNHMCSFLYGCSENAKSAQYVSCSTFKGKNIGIMFLVEAALGQEHHITKDDSTLTAPPPGFDCVIAKGRREPNAKDDTVMSIDGRRVAVPQGKPIDMQQYKNSSFFNSEYLLYKESQQHLRYVMTLKFQ